MVVIPNSTDSGETTASDSPSRVGQSPSSVPEVADKLQKTIGDLSASSVDVSSFLQEAGLSPKYWDIRSNSRKTALRAYRFPENMSLTPLANQIIAEPFNSKSFQGFKINFGFAMNATELDPMMKVNNLWPGWHAFGKIPSPNQDFFDSTNTGFVHLTLLLSATDSSQNILAISTVQASTIQVPEHTLGQDWKKYCQGVAQRLESLVGNMEETISERELSDNQSFQNRIRRVKDSIPLVRAADPEAIRQASRHAPWAYSDRLLLFGAVALALCNDLGINTVAAYSESPVGSTAQEGYLRSKYRRLLYDRIYSFIKEADQTKVKLVDLMTFRQQYGIQ